MIVVDTSVWIAFLRNGDPTVVTELDALLDEDTVALPAPVRLELLSGASGKHRKLLSTLLGALPVFFPSRDTFRLAETWIEKARTAGHAFGAMDLLIAATAAEHGAAVWSLDGDFQRLARLGLVKLHRPR
jgi:predicted nucleic acid-binding protein